MTKAQRRVMAALDHGGALWLVGDEERMESIEGDPTAHYIVAEFNGDELAGTWKPQQRTLMSLCHMGLIDLEW